MQLIRSIHSPNLPKQGCVLTIGNFDAVHIGHRSILKTLVQQAKQQNLPSAVMTFDPHPQEYFRAASLRSTESRDKPSATPPVARLTTTSMRYLALQQCNLDIMLSLRFDHDLAQTSAEDFIRYYLAERLRVKYLLVGDDFHFGAKRKGDFNMLTQMADRYGYQVARIDAVKQQDTRISSTWIRELLSAGSLDKAEQLLGRKYAYSGRVIHGEKRGRKWGFPTLNIAIKHAPALRGVFAVRVVGLEAGEENALPGVASIGTRPTIENKIESDSGGGGGDGKGHANNLLEVYLFQYDGDAYGKRICVEFIKKIRDEEKFENYDALIKKIKQDVCIAKEIITEQKN